MDLSLSGFALLWGNNMNISKKVPITVSIVLLVIWCFLGFRSAENIDARVASPMFMKQITITEDVRIVDLNQEIDAALYGESYNYTDIPAGSKGDVEISYSRWHKYINDLESETHSYRAYFYPDGKSTMVHIITGSETELGPDGIYYKNIENFQEIISEYNQKVKEAKTKWVIQLLLRILNGILVAAIFSGIFWLECFIANKIKMKPVGFAIICILYVLVLLLFISAAIYF